VRTPRRLDAQTITLPGAPPVGPILGARLRLRDVRPRESPITRACIALPRSLFLRVGGCSGPSGSVSSQCIEDVIINTIVLQLTLYKERGGTHPPEPPEPPDPPVRTPDVRGAPTVMVVRGAVRHHCARANFA